MWPAELRKSGPVTNDGEGATGDSFSDSDMKRFAHAGGDDDSYVVKDYRNVVALS